MKKLTILFLLILFSAFVSGAQVANVTYNITNVSSAASITLTPLYNGGLSGTYLVTSGARTLPLIGTNSATFTNVPMGYSYQVLVKDVYYHNVSAWTNQFPINLSGNINGGNWIFWNFVQQGGVSPNGFDTNGSAAAVQSGLTALAANALTNNQTGTISIPATTTLGSVNNLLSGQLIGIDGNIHYDGASGFNGAFTGNATGLTNLNAGNITSASTNTIYYIDPNAINAVGVPNNPLFPYKCSDSLNTAAMQPGSATFQFLNGVNMFANAISNQTAIGQSQTQTILLYTNSGYALTGDGAENAIFFISSSNNVNIGNFTIGAIPGGQWDQTNYVAVFYTPNYKVNNSIAFSAYNINYPFYLQIFGITNAGASLDGFYLRNSQTNLTVNGNNLFMDVPWDSFMDYDVGTNNITLTGCSFDSRQVYYSNGNSGGTGHCFNFQNIGQGSKITAQGCNFSTLITSNIGNPFSLTENTSGTGSNLVFNFINCVMTNASTPSQGQGDIRISMPATFTPSNSLLNIVGGQYDYNNITWQAQGQQSFAYIYNYQDYSGNTPSSGTNSPSALSLSDGTVSRFNDAKYVMDSTVWNTMLTQVMNLNTNVATVSATGNDGTGKMGAWSLASANPFLTMSAAYTALVVSGYSAQQNYIVCQGSGSTYTIGSGATITVSIPITYLIGTNTVTSATGTGSKINFTVPCTLYGGTFTNLTFLGKTSLKWSTVLNGAPAQNNAACQGVSFTANNCRFYMTNYFSNPGQVTTLNINNCLICVTNSGSTTVPCIGIANSTTFGGKIANSTIITGGSFQSNICVVATSSQVQLINDDLIVLTNGYATNGLQILCANPGSYVYCDQMPIPNNVQTQNNGNVNAGLAQQYLVTFGGTQAAPTSIGTFPATTVTWTNSNAYDIELYINNSGVTGTALQKNGTTIATVLTSETIGLQPGEYFSETYTVGTPSATYSPR